jgi:hypothetical protein
MSTDTDRGFPDSTLCTRCANLKLTAADFYLTEDKVEETPNKSNVYDPITIDTRKWQDIEISKKCNLCRVIKSAVETSRFEWQSSEPPNSCAIKKTRLHGSHNGDTVKYDIRYLEIVAHYNWTSSNDILLLPVESDEHPGCFPGRTVDPQGISIERIRAWMDQCQSTHGNKCQHVETSQFQGIREDILVLDVDEQRLVQLPSDARYIALSYVWGNVEQPKTFKSTVELYKAHKGLVSVYQQLPRTILDAMRFVRALGERYLWVDTLCIIQDDIDFKGRVINSMNTIYENAYLTLFASTGADSNAGLPGLRPTPRGISQLVTNISDGLKLLFPINYQHIKRSSWATRAWTYQEYFFAKRRLLFVDGQVVYQCNTMRWREDIVQEHLEKGLTHYQVNGAGSRMDWEPPALRYVNAPSDDWSRFHFNRYVETYLDRNLTFDSDVLSAFAGIINEAANKKLEVHLGLTEKYFGMDMLWMPCRWLVRRPGFPSWSWAGWKGPVICFGTSSEEIWQHRRSWIDWYVFRKSSGAFQLLSSGYSPQQETVIVQEEELEHQREERIESMRREEYKEQSSDDQRKPKHSIGHGEGALASLLWRLCQSNNVAASNERESPYPLYCTPAVNEQTLLFRTLTAYVSISSLNPEGKMSLPPRDDQLTLPSAPSLHLYAPDNTHIGIAWSHTQEFFDKVVSYDKDVVTKYPNACRLKIEIAFIAGPLDGDWRTRNERMSTWEYMRELAAGDLHLGMLFARYQQRLDYEQAIAKVYISMVREREAAEKGADGVETRLTVAFWEELELRIALMDLKKVYPGHCEETLRPVIDGLTAGGMGMKTKEGQKFMKVMLIGNLGDGETNGSGGIKERVGMGDIREDAMGLILGLALRDVMLK